MYGLQNRTLFEQVNNYFSDISELTIYEWFGWI